MKNNGLTIAFVGLSLDFDLLKELSLPDRHTYKYITDEGNAGDIGEADEVIFVVSKYNNVSTKLIAILEAVDKVTYNGKKWLFNLDGCNIHPVYRQLLGIPEGPPWLLSIK